MTASSLLVEPAFRSQPAFRDTLGPEVADVARMAGFAPDPEQQLALDALFAFGVDGKVAAFEFAVICSRQNMKTGLFKMAALGWLFVTEQQLIVWSAHEMKTTKEAFRDLENLITGCPALKSRLADGPSEGIHRGNGEESIELAPTPTTPTGQRVMFKARTNGGGRGLSGDKVILDEAFALKPSHMGSLLPTLSARPDPQIVYGSSAGLAESDVLRAVRDRGRPGRGRLAYFEWCAPEGGCGTATCNHQLGTPDCALDDRGNWQRANPALGRRITEEYIAAEREALPVSEFARERLGWWDDATAGGVFNVGVWEALTDPHSRIDGPVTFAVEVAEDRSWACVAASGDGPNGVHVEVTGTATLSDYRPGTGWVVPRVVELAARHVAVNIIIQPNSAAGSLIADLTDAGVTVVKATTQEYAQACGMFFDLVAESALRHLSQPELDLSVRAAHKKPAGDAWLWNRRNPNLDISPLVAVTLAVWGHKVHGSLDVSESIW